MLERSFLTTQFEFTVSSNTVNPCFVSKKNQVIEKEREEGERGGRGRGGTNQESRSIDENKNGY